jgi:hypothetical protein
MICGKEQERIMGNCLEKRGLGEKNDTFRHKMIRRKEQARIIGKYLDKRWLRREELYIQTQNDTRKAASKNIRKVFRETRVRDRRAIN